METSLPRPAVPSLLPPVFSHASPAPDLLTQGAEALLYKTTFLFPSCPCALKYRPSKSYRHPTLDKRLTRHRILSEARILVKCRREGVQVPGVLALDAEGGGVDSGGGGWMLIEWIDGKTVRDFLVDRARRRKLDQNDSLKDEDWSTMLLVLMAKIGRAVARLHEIGVIHGDLTTSNLMLRPLQAEPSSLDGAGLNGQRDHKEQKSTLEGDIVLIDFGLAGQSIQDEDKAVDLYVLERAFGSTHPEEEDYFQEVLRVYKESYKGAKVALKRLEDVRMRGRKKSMVG